MAATVFRSTPETRGIGNTSFRAAVIIGSSRAALSTSARGARRHTNYLHRRGSNARIEVGGLSPGSDRSFGVPTPTENIACRDRTRVRESGRDGVNAGAETGHEGWLGAEGSGPIAHLGDLIRSPTV